MKIEDKINRRNFIEGLGVLSGSLASFDSLEALARESGKEIFYINGRASIRSLEINSDGETEIYYNNGKRNNSVKSYVSLGNKNNSYKITFKASRNKRVSVRFFRGNKFGGIDTRYGPLEIEVKNNSFVTIDNRGESLIPLIRTFGFFNVKSGKNLEIHYDEEDKGVKIVRKNTKQKGIFVPPFQLDPYESEGESKIEPWETFYLNPWESIRSFNSEDSSYFVDCFGRLYGTGMGLMGIAKEARAIKLYGLNRSKQKSEESEQKSELNKGIKDKDGYIDLGLNGFKPNYDYSKGKLPPGSVPINLGDDIIGNEEDDYNEDLYFPTKAFAQLWDKETFWDKFVYWEQIKFRNASLHRLKSAIK